MIAKTCQNSQDRPYLHLVDGGLVDNLGVRSLLELIEGLETQGASLASSDATSPEQ